MTAARAIEIARYVELYAGPCGRKYRTTALRLGLFRRLLAERPDLWSGGLLDVGAGHGTMLRAASEAGMAQVAGTEVVLALCGPAVTQAPAWALPFPDSSFGTVACFDVLEHLLPADVAAALGELARVARDRIIVEVSCRPSNWRDARGQLHMTIWPPLKWLAAAATAWAPRVVASPRVDLETERAACVIEGLRRPPL